MTDFRHRPTLTSGLFWPLLLLVLLLGREVAAQQQVREYDVKAVFLYNLTHFVNWPPDKVAESEAILVGVYGPDPFGEILDHTVAAETKYGRPFAVLRFSAPEQILPCHLLFITREGMEDWPRIRELVADQPILTVADSPGFAEQGGMVNLLTREQKVEVEINHHQVRETGLSMSAKLLSLARLVDEVADAE